MIRTIFALAFTCLCWPVLAADHVSPIDQKSYYIAEYWSGEWPPGVAVGTKDLTVMGRKAMDKSATADVLCDLPLGAVYHPWNTKRSERDKVRYVTASRIVPLTAKKDFQFPTDPFGEAKMLLKRGTLIEYLVYGGEGSFKVRINGQEYEADQSLYENVAAVPDDAYAADEWLNLTCTDGQTAWLLLEDLQKTTGIWKVQMGGPVNDYGSARDLTKQEIKKGLGE